jgi:hypothetical protein
MPAKLQSLPIWGRAIVLGLMFGVLTMLVNSLLFHHNDSVIVQGVVAGVVFALLMGPYIAWLHRSEKQQRHEEPKRLHHSSR